jgi:glycerophosphoryl diester phosphodiesterase
MEIISHRYLTQGKNKETENTLSQLKFALNEFVFFETDIRRLPSGEFYISHDPQNILTEENNAIQHAKFWKSNNAKIALNIKELGYEKDLVEFLKAQEVIGNIFLFDFDIEFLGIEPQSYINSIHQYEPKLECAVRVSDRMESVERALQIKNSKIIWLDEFDSLWVKQEDIQVLKNAGRIVYCIGPDLHNFSLAETESRFKDFIKWKVDGICTDYSLLLRRILG